MGPLRQGLKAGDVPVRGFEVSVAQRQGGGVDGELLPGGGGGGVHSQSIMPISKGWVSS